MTEIPAPPEGALVPDPAAAARYDDPGRPLRVLVRVDYADGRVREYEARDPQDLTVSDPQDLAAMTIRPTGLSMAAGRGTAALRAAVPSLRLSFTAHPRWNMHVRTEATAAPWEPPWMA